MKHIDSAHLTKGQRQFLARKGIKGREWDEMKPEDQAEWMEEMQEATYEINDREQRTQNDKFTY